MNLKEMEDAAQKRQEKEAASAALRDAAILSDEAQRRSILEIRAAEYLAEMTGASLEDLEDAISVPHWDDWHCQIELSIPEHATICTSLKRDKSGMEMSWHLPDRRKWRIYNPYGGDRYCQNLGDALAIAARMWAEVEKVEQRATEQAEKQEAERRQRKLDRAERGLHYVGIFEDHPFLKPIFDLLVAYVEDKGGFEADLEAAEEFAASMNESYMRKPNESRMAQAEADNARHRLQQDLWAEQDARREAERKRRKW